MRSSVWGLEAQWAHRPEARGARKFDPVIRKGTHTCEFHPQRFDAWRPIAREEAAAFG